MYKNPGIKWDTNYETLHIGEEFFFLIVKELRIFKPSGLFCWIMLERRSFVEKSTLNFLKFFIYSLTS